jgi:hypothetical protein
VEGFEFERTACIPRMDQSSVTKEGEGGTKGEQLQIRPDMEWRPFHNKWKETGEGKGRKERKIREQLSALEQNNACHLRLYACEQANVFQAWTKVLHAHIKKLF